MEIETLESMIKKGQIQVHADFEKWYKLMYPSNSSTKLLPSSSTNSLYQANVTKQVNSKVTIVQTGNTKTDQEIADFYKLRDNFVNKSPLTN
jgi:hypothetical protein